MPRPGSCAGRQGVTCQWSRWEEPWRRPRGVGSSWGPSSHWRSLGSSAWPLAPQALGSACHSSLADVKPVPTLCASSHLEDAPSWLFWAPRFILMHLFPGLPGRVTRSPPRPWTNQRHSAPQAELKRSVYLPIFHTCNYYTETLKEINRQDRR